MDSELWKRVYAAVTGLGKHRPAKAQFSDGQIVGVFLWAVLHDRPLYWATRSSNWPLHLRRLRRPSASTLSRRLRTPSVQELLMNLDKSGLTRPRSACRWIDGKPLPIGGNTQDSQAAYGRAAGCMAKGYKLHAVADEQQGFVTWTVTAMNVNEKLAARELVACLDPAGHLVGDNNYDSNILYELAGNRGIQLVAPPRKGRKGIGHCQQSRHRLKALELLEHADGRTMLKRRAGIERMFGQFTNVGFGLKPLPNWIRGLHRVRLWVQGKIILYHLWLNSCRRTSA